MKLYVSGEMSGKPNFNYETFEEATACLRSLKHEVVSPHELDDPEEVAGLDPNAVPEEKWQGFLARDLAHVVDPSVEAVVVLEGWERSRGARLEVYVARQLGKPILSYPDLKPVSEPENVLEEANRIVSGTRGDSYGHPSDDFQRTAKVMGAVLGIDVTPEQVALTMIGVKISRLVASPHHRDSVVDIAGYVKCYEMVRERTGGLR